MCPQRAQICSVINLLHSLIALIVVSFESFLSDGHALLHSGNMVNWFFLVFSWEANCTCLRMFSDNDNSELLYGLRDVEMSFIHIFTISYQEFPLALVRKPDCFCGYTTPRFTLHEPVREELCAVENSSLPTQGSRRHFLQVYQTPVQGKTLWKPHWS